MDMVHDNSKDLCYNNGQLESEDIFFKTQEPQIKVRNSALLPQMLWPNNV
jgi:hypothetical protein